MTPEEKKRKKTAFLRKKLILKKYPKKIPAGIEPATNRLKVERSTELS